VLAIAGAVNKMINQVREIFNSKTNIKQEIYKS
jgi:hypothetical protein